MSGYLHHSHRAILAAVAFCFASQAQAQCWLNNTDNNKADYFMVNGLINLADPEIIFDLPGDSLGNGSYIPTSSILNPGNDNRPDEVRFRLDTQDMPNKNSSVVMSAYSGTPLTCTNCSSTVNIPLSKIYWQSSLNTGSQPADGNFNGGLQTWITAPAKTNNLFFLQFDFLNDTVYPAGTYTGEFYTRGVPIQ